jgi:hypothetical protein
LWTVKLVVHALTSRLKKVKAVLKYGSDTQKIIRSARVWELLRKHRILKDYQNTY